jgi:hypothetical protein
MDAPPNVDCKHCVKGKGCSIQETKPTKCREFECAYYQSSKAPIELRPDNCKMIFEKISDQLFIGTLDARFELTKTAREQVDSFINQGYSVILGATDYRKPKIFIHQGHNEEEIFKQWRTTEQT